MGGGQEILYSIVMRVIGCVAGSELFAAWRSVVLWIENGHVLFLTGDDGGEDSRKRRSNEKLKVQMPNCRLEKKGRLTSSVLMSAWFHRSKRKEKENKKEKKK